MFFIPCDVDDSTSQKCANDRLFFLPEFLFTPDFFQLGRAQAYLRWLCTFTADSAHFAQNSATMPY